MRLPNSHQLQNDSFRHLEVWHSLDLQVRLLMLSISALSSYRLKNLQRFSKDKNLGRFLKGPVFN